MEEEEEEAEKRRSLLDINRNEIQLSNKIKCILFKGIRVHTNQVYVC